MGDGNKLKVSGYKPYPHQKAVHKLLATGRGSGKIVVVKSRRQCGKSMMIENELLRYALVYPRSTSICLSPTLNQSRKVYKDIISAGGNTKLISAANAQLLEITFINGSQILFKSAEQGESLRGYTVSGILCIDECAFIPDDVFYIVLPWTDVHKAPILMTSTPKFKEGFYFQYYTLGLQENNKNIYSVDWNDFDLSFILSDEKLQEYKRLLPKAQFTSEYLAEFLDDDGMVFTGFKECTGVCKDDGVSPLYMGIDWANGGGNDYTVVSMFDDKAQQVYLQRFNDLSPTQQIDRIYNIIMQYEDRLVSIRPELNSIGTPYTDVLKERLQGRAVQSKINGFTTTNSTKADLVTNLQMGFEQHRLTIQNNPDLIREIGMYAAEYNPKTKIITYNAPSGCNDDTVIATMLSYQALTDDIKIGDYIYGFA